MRSSLNKQTYFLGRDRLGSLDDHAIRKSAEKLSVLLQKSLVLVNQETHEDVPKVILSFFGEGFSQSGCGLAWKRPCQPISSILAV